MEVLALHPAGCYAGIDSTLREHLFIDDVRSISYNDDSYGRRTPFRETHHPGHAPRGI